MQNRHITNGNCSPP